MIKETRAKSFHLSTKRDTKIICFTFLAKLLTLAWAYDLFASKIYVVRKWTQCNLMNTCMIMFKIAGIVKKRI